MQAYSQDLRDRVLRALERGDRPVDMAERFEVSREWVYRVKDRLESEGLRHSFQRGGHRQSRLAPLESKVREWIKAQPDLTLAELGARAGEHGVTIKAPAFWHQLNQWNLSLKKNPCTPASKRAKTCRRRELSGKKTSPRLM